MPRTKKPKCDFILTSGKNVGKQCQRPGTNKINGKNLCRRHKDKASRDVERPTLQNDDVFGSSNISNSTPTKKTLKSVFNITVNTNKDISSLSTDDKQKFKQLIEYMFQDQNIKKYIKDISNPSDPNENLVDIRHAYTFEVGNVGNRLHVHALIDLTHNGFYQFKVSEFRTIINSYMGWKTHINVQAQKSGTNSNVWERYINKTIN